MLGVVVTLVATSVTGWVALRVTLWDISERGSLQVARDLGPLADQDIRATGRLTARVLGPGTIVVEAVRSDGTVLLTPGEDVTLSIGGEELQAAQLQKTSVRNTAASTGETYRVVAVPLAKTGDVLVVGRPLTPSYEILHVFGLVVLGVGAVGIGWAWLLGRLIARSALGPVRRFTRAMRHVAETDDLHPIPDDSCTDADFAALTGTFNQMLSRLARSRDQQNQLIADASHELRTPLTSVRTNIELLALDLNRNRFTDDDRRQILDDVQARTVEFTALIGDLVLLARETTSNTREPVDLRDIVDTAIARVQRRCPSSALDVGLDSLELDGDAASLERAVTNLLDNAIKWSPTGGVIHVQLRGNQLRIADEGIGIATADLPYVFDRFYRSDTARNTPGTGLGLALAAKAAHDHGGTLQAARSPHGGAQLTLTLPGTPRTTERPTAGQDEHSHQRYATSAT